MSWYIFLCVGHFGLLHHTKKQEEEKEGMCDRPGVYLCGCDRGVCERWMCDRGTLLWGVCERWMCDRGGVLWGVCERCSCLLITRLPSDCAFAL